MKTTMTLTFAIVTFMASSIPDAASGDDNDATKQEGLLAGMRLRAAETQVVQLGDDKPVLLKASAEPLFRYSDEPRDILDATMWAYGTPGRPAAIQKIEVYHDRGAAKWFYCLASFSEGLLKTNWRDGETWSSQKPGITFRTLADAPQPAASAFQRLLQMKTVSRRFDALLFNEPTDNPVKKPVNLRPLPRPLYRYSDLKEGIEDGALFGFATNGTNPDTLLAIEVHRAGVSGHTWKYGLVRMTLYQVIVKLDNIQVWQVPYVPYQGPDRPSKFDSWLFFHEALAN